MIAEHEQTGNWLRRMLSATAMRIGMKDAPPDRDQVVQHGESVMGLIIRRILVTCCLLSGWWLPVGQGDGRTNLSRTAAAAAPLYVAIGASDAFGIGTDDPLVQNWPHDIAAQLTPAPHLINLGIPGATVDLATRAELPIALATQPTLVTVWLGVNDFDDKTPLPTFSQHLQVLLTTLARATPAEVWVGNLPDLALLPHFATWNQGQLATQVAAWNAAISAACLSTGAHLVDLYARWHDLAAHPEYLGPDHFHPSTLGAQRIAALFVQSIAAIPPPAVDA